MKRRGGIGRAMDVIEQLAKQGPFRARALNSYELSQNWLNVAQGMGLVRKHGHGVWSSASYEPTRYEIFQLRFPHAVFWGPSALWLHAALDAEPEPMWIAIANTSRASSTIALDTVIIRTRQLERDLENIQPVGRRIKLRAHNLERAGTDAEKIDPYRVMEGAVERSRFSLPPHARFLSATMPPNTWHPIPAPRDEWEMVPASAATRTPAPARSHSGSTTLPSPPRR